MSDLLARADVETAFNSAPDRHKPDLEPFYFLWIPFKKLLRNKSDTNIESIKLCLQVNSHRYVEGGGTRIGVSYIGTDRCLPKRVYTRFENEL